MPKRWNDLLGKFVWEPHEQAGEDEQPVADPSVVDALNTLRAAPRGSLRFNAAFAVVETALADHAADELFVLATTYQRMSVRVVAAEAERDAALDREAGTADALDHMRQEYERCRRERAVLAGEEPT